MSAIPFLLVLGEVYPLEIDMIGPEQFRQLRTWQVERLRERYRDLGAIPSYRPAVRFFLERLYGDRDFGDRDGQFQRAYPILERTLPGRLLHTADRAWQLNQLSRDLDLRLAQVLFEEMDWRGPIEEQPYKAAFRHCDNKPERQRQLRLIEELGEDLFRAVRLPVLPSLLRMSRRPAQLAGFGELQGFLEEGFSAFRALGGSRRFLDIVLQREQLALDEGFQVPTASG